MSTDVLSSKVQNVSHGFEKVITTCVTMNYLPLVEQELLTLLEDLSSPLIFSGVRVTRFLVLVCPFVLVLLAIVLSVLLRYTDSDYPFGIVKLFLPLWNT
jgi:hypothetical protein